MTDPYEKFTFEVQRPSDDDDSFLAEWRRQIMAEPEPMDVVIEVNDRRWLLKNAILKLSFGAPLVDVSKLTALWEAMEGSSLAFDKHADDCVAIMPAHATACTCGLEQITAALDALAETEPVMPGRTGLLVTTESPEDVEEIARAVGAGPAESSPCGFCLNPFTPYGGCHACGRRWGTCRVEGASPMPWKAGLGYDQRGPGFYIADANGRIVFAEHDVFLTEANSVALMDLINGAL